MSDIDEIEWLREEVRVMRATAVPRDEYDLVQDEIGQLRDEIDRLREALRVVTDDFAAVMAGPRIAGAGVTFENGVEGVPSIAYARTVLGGPKP